MFLCSCTWFNAVNQKEYFENKDDHAGEMETSMMMHLVPEWVRPLSEAGDGKAKKFVFTAMQEGWAWAERRWTAVTEDTGVGDPSKASAEKGRKFFEATTQKVSEFFVQVAKTDREKFYS
jgi:creatinine amidohydrolase